VVRVCHKRIKLSLISAVTNKGELRWMIVDGAVNAPTFLRFLERLIREARGKLFLILDRLRVHRARLVRDWVAEHPAAIELHYLPSYSPELNPDEGGHGDLKQAVPRKPPARSKAQLKGAVIGHMRKLSTSPHRGRSSFGHKTFRYAA
jgi:DDE superfamily endonuclease